MCEIIQSLAKDETKRQLRSPNPLEDKRGAPGRALRPFRCRPRSALLKGHSHAMSDRKSIVGDPEIIRARAMETLFERLESLCEGAIAIDRAGHVVYVNEKYLHSLRLNHVSEAIGRPIEEIIPNSLMRRVAETGEPILLDIMELGGEQLVVTRMPIEDENRKVIGAIGFVLSDHIDNLKPLIARMSQLEADLRLAKRQLSQARTARFTFDDYVGETLGIARAKELAGRAARQNVTVLLLGETGTGKYSAMVRSLTDRFYSGVSRYTTSGFLRIKLGEALEKRGVAAHIFESAQEAQSDWRNVEGVGG
jgi:transcriptional regulator of acetoin/glycerol metabolism